MGQVLAIRPLLPNSAVLLGVLLSSIPVVLLFLSWSCFYFYSFWSVTTESLSGGSAVLLWRLASSKGLGSGATDQRLMRQSMLSGGSIHGFEVVLHSFAQSHFGSVS